MSRNVEQPHAMNILFLSQVLPYPTDAGPKVRSYFVLRHLAQRHRITLLSFVRDTDTEAAVAHLKTICHAVHTVPIRRSTLSDLFYLGKSLVARTPFIVERDWLPAMQHRIAQLLEGEKGFDAIHSDQLWMARYALWAQWQMRHRNYAPLLVLDQHNAVYRIPQRMAADESNPLRRAFLALEWRKMARYEVETSSRFDRVIWVTAEDYAAVQEQAKADEPPVPNSGIIPICADPESEPVIPRTPSARRITFFGGLHYPPNAQGVLWFAKEIFPLVLRHVPDALLTIIGKQPPAQLTQLGLPQANLEVTGYVDDLKPYLAETAVSIVPLLAGGGMRVKIIDAWTWGIPVVSTTIGAEGIAARANVNIRIADRADDFAQATISLLQNPAQAEQIAQAARQTVCTEYNWRTRYRAWESVYARSSALPAVEPVLATRMQP